MATRGNNAIPSHKTPIPRNLPTSRKATKVENSKLRPLPQLLSPTPSTGSVSVCVGKWKQLTPAITITSVKSKEEYRLVEQEVQSLCQKGAVVLAHPHQDQFITRLFQVAKKDGSYRPVVNLKPLNCFVWKYHFKMQGSMMIKGSVATKGLDVHPRFERSVSVSLEDRKYLRFVWMYKFTCLPFGLCSAPCTFMKLLRPAMAHLWKQGIHSIIYLDDILFMYQSREGLLHQVGLAIQLLESLGFTNNREKSQLTLSQRIQFLGIQVNSQEMKLFLPEERMPYLRISCQSSTYHSSWENFRQLPLQFYQPQSATANCSK